MNILKMMQQAGEMKSKMSEIQARMEAEEAEGSSGGGLVKATINGKGRALRLSIDPSLINPSEKKRLEDLVLAAFNDAKNKNEKTLAGTMGEMMGDLKLPPGMKLPF